MTLRAPLLLIVTGVAACAPHTSSSRPTPPPTLSAEQLTALACARTQALAMGYSETTQNSSYTKAHDDGGRTTWDMLGFRIVDSKLVVGVVGSPSHTPPSSEAQLAKEQIERRCSPKPNG